MSDPFRARPKTSGTDTPDTTVSRDEPGPVKPEPVEQPDAAESAPTTVVPPVPPRARLEDMTKPQLQDLARARGVDDTGTKHTLIDRLTGES